MYRARRRKSWAPVFLLALLGAAAVCCAFYLQYKTELFRFEPKSALTSARAGELVITAVMPKNDSARLIDGEICDFLELTNASDKEISLAGWTLARGDNQVSLYALGGDIPPGGVLVVPFYAGAPFKLSASGMTLTLLDPAGAVADKLITPELELNALWKLVDGEWVITEYAPEMIENPAIIITEVMPRGDAGDYVEIYNRSESEIDLTGWYLSDSIAAPYRWRFPGGVIRAREYLVVYLDGLDKADANGALHASFRLAKEGETVSLHSPDGARADIITYPALLKAQAYSRVSPSDVFAASGSETPFGDTGSDLPAAPGADGDIWVSSIPATPGASNDATGIAEADAEFLATHGNGVYIARVSAVATAEMPDWIAIRNSTGADFELSGCGLSDEPGAPRKYRFPEGTIIPAGSEKIIYMSGYPDASGYETHASFRLSAAGGYSITLSYPDGALFDKLYIPPQTEGRIYGRANGAPGYIEN